MNSDLYLKSVWWRINDDYNETLLFKTNLNLKDGAKAWIQEVERGSNLNGSAFHKSGLDLQSQHANIEPALWSAWRHTLAPTLHCPLVGANISTGLHVKCEHAYANIRNKSPFTLRSEQFAHSTIKHERAQASHLNRYLCVYMYAVCGQSSEYNLSFSK